MDTRGELVRPRDLAVELLGSDTPANRKMIDRLIERRVVAVVRIGPRGDRLVIRRTVDAWLTTSLEEFTSELADTMAAMQQRARRHQERPSVPPPQPGEPQRTMNADNR